MTTVLPTRVHMSLATSAACNQLKLGTQIKIGYSKKNVFTQMKTGYQKFKICTQSMF